VGRLFLTADKFGQKGSKPARIKTLCYPSSPRDDAVGTDIEDVCIIELKAEVTTDFFNGTAYVIDEATVATGVVAHELQVVGVLKDKSRIDPPDIHMVYCRLQLTDAGPSTSDPVLRHAVATFAQPEFDNITGLSGSPVFDVTANALCGMVGRGGMNGNQCNIYYVDIADIVQCLDCVATGRRTRNTRKICRGRRPDFTRSRRRPSFDASRQVRGCADTSSPIASCPYP
jgi:hypothetical protein